MQFENVCRLMFCAHLYSDLVVVLHSCACVYLWYASNVAATFIAYLSRVNLWVSFAPEFQCCYFYESSCLFYLSFNSDFYVFKIMHL